MTEDKLSYKELEEENLLLQEAILELAGETNIEEVENELFKNRYLYIHDEISQDTLSQISPIIDYYNLEDEGLPKNERMPIKIKIGTYGGEAYEALAIIDAIEASVTPVHAHVEGKSMSAGLFIWASAHKRSMGKRAVMMYHQIQLNGIGGTLQQVKKQIKEFERMQNILDELLNKRLNLSKKFLKKLNKKNEDWYIDYNMAKEFEMI